MEFLPLMSLFDLCATRMAYLMWARRDVASNCFEEELLNELKNAVFDDVKSLILPEEVKSCVLKHLRPAGDRLLSLLNLWLSKLPSGTPQKWLLGNMLFDCLILNADGLINQRKTAQTILRSRMLDHGFAFRLASINFLENQVLKLWIYSKGYFLRKIVMENQHLHQLPQLYFYEEGATNFSTLTAATESEEVLFWISYCLSKENETDIKKVPHFKGNDVDWYGSLFQSASSSGNVACFEYFKCFFHRNSEFDPVDIIKKIFYSTHKECEQASFIFHFKLINFDEKSKLFREFPYNMVSQFLQWPLSQTTLEKREEIWDLIPVECHDNIFKDVTEILINENILLEPSSAEDRKFFRFFLLLNNVPYCVEHLSEIWIDLWNKTLLDSEKIFFLNSFLSPDFEYFYSSDSDESPEGPKSSGLKQKLQSLFLKNGEALLELFEGNTVNESLRNLVARYMPEDFQNIDRECFSLLSSRTLQYGRKKKKPEKKMVPRVMKYPRNSVDGNYLNYIKRIFFSSDY